MQEAQPRDIRFFKDDDGAEPVKDWLESLRKKGKSVEVTKINTRIDRAGMGNFGDHRFLSGGFGELKIDYGAGYRVYFGLDGDEFVLLLHGGTKSNQQENIELAQKRWHRYLEGKNKEATHGK